MFPFKPASSMEPADLSHLEYSLKMWMQGAPVDAGGLVG